MGLTVHFEVLNQLGTPLMYSETLANRPAAGIAGRIFFRTDSPYGIYRDTGTAWDLIAQSTGGSITGSGTVGTLPIWTSSSALGNSTLIEGATLISTTKDIKADAFYLTGAAAGNGALYWTSDRVTLANYNVGGTVKIEVNGGNASTTFGTDLSLTNNGYISAVPTLTAANNASSVSIVGVNTLSYAAAFSANNIGSVYGGIAVYNLQTFAGSATFANSNVASGGSSVNSIDFSTGGSTITMTQSSGIRAMTGQQNLFQYQGTNSGTITHAAISQNTGFYRPSAATGILTITNAYSHLINALDDYGAGFTFTNRWGIYQAGASDVNYFAANVLIGSSTNSGEKVIINGTLKVLNANILLSNNWALTGRNFADTLNLSLISRNTSDRVIIDPDGYGTNIGGGGSVIINAAGGNLLIGTTIDAGQKLQVNGNAAVNGNVALTGSYSGVSAFLTTTVAANVGTFGSAGNLVYNQFTANATFKVHPDPVPPVTDTGLVGNTVY